VNQLSRPERIGSASAILIVLSAETRKKEERGADHESCVEIRHSHAVLYPLQPRLGVKPGVILPLQSLEEQSVGQFGGRAAVESSSVLWVVHLLAIVSRELRVAVVAVGLSQIEEVVGECRLHLSPLLWDQADAEGLGSVVDLFGGEEVEERPRWQVRRVGMSRNLFAWSLPAQRIPNKFKHFMALG
jgi:hypothetical protein